MGAKILEKYKLFMDGISQAFSWFLIAVLGVMTAATFVNVVLRYCFSYSIPWADPVARFGQTWIMLLGSGLVLRKGMHIGLESVLNLLPKTLKQIVRRINVLVVMFFAIVMLTQGFKIADIVKDSVIPEMGIPMRYVYYMIPVASVYLILTCLEFFLKKEVGSLVAGEQEQQS